MSKKVGSIHYDLDLNKDKFDRKSHAVGKKVGALAKKMAVLGVAVAGVFAVTAVKAASDLVETINKVDVAFGKNAEEVKKWSKTTIDQYGMAGSSAMESAALFGDMGTSMGLSTKEASDMSMSMTGLAGDLASFKNIGVDQATTALAGVFTGETESLKKLGIVMTQTQLEQYAMTQGITKSYKEMSQAEKVSLRYGYVMDKTKNAQGDFARTSEGTANQMRITKERFKELQEQIGMKLLPVANKFLAFLQAIISNERIIAVVDEIGRVFRELAPKVQEVAQNVADYLLPKLQNLWDKIMNDVIPALKDFWKNVIEPIIPVIGVVLVGALGLLIDTLGFLADKIEIVMPILVAFGALIVGAKVAGAILTLTQLIGIGAHMGLMGSLSSLSAMMGSSAMLGPWAVFAAVAVGALYAVMDQANKTKDALDDLAGISEDATERMKVAKEEFDAGKITAEEYKLRVDEAKDSANNASIAAYGARVEMETSIAGRIANSASRIFRQFTGQRAGGGPVSSSGRYLVGEQGPEMFVPRSEGTIIPAGRTEQMMQSQSTSIYGNISIGSQQDADYFFKQLSRNQELSTKGLSSRVGTV